MVWGPLASTQDRQKSRKKSEKNNCKNPFQKGSKIMKNRGLGGSWGPWGAVWGPSGPPGSPRTAQSRKRVEKAGSLTAPRDPKMDNFRYLFVFFCIILRCFFEAVFGRPWDLIFRGFGDDFRGRFRCFFDGCVREAATGKTSIYSGFSCVGGTSAFSEKRENHIFFAFFWGLFPEGPPTAIVHRF